YRARIETLASALQDALAAYLRVSGPKSATEEKQVEQAQKDLEKIQAHNTNMLAYERRKKEAKEKSNATTDSSKAKENSNTTADPSKAKENSNTTADPSKAKENSNTTADPSKAKEDPSKARTQSSQRRKRPAPKAIDFTNIDPQDNSLGKLPLELRLEIF